MTKLVGLIIKHMMSGRKATKTCSPEFFTKRLLFLHTESLVTDIQISIISSVVLKLAFLSENRESITIFQK